MNPQLDRSETRTGPSALAKTSPPPARLDTSYMLETTRIRWTALMAVLYWTGAAVLQISYAVGLNIHTRWTWTILAIDIVMGVVCLATPWERIAAKGWFVANYHIGVAVVVATAFNFRLPAELVLLFPISSVLANVYWSRKVLLGLNMAVIYGAFVVSAVAISGNGETQWMAIGVPVMLASVLS